MKSQWIFRLAVTAAAVMVLLPFSLWAAGPNKGAEQIVIDGGHKGPVPFAHHRHQAALSDCNACHTIFPQEPGSIERLKAAGTLKAKSDVMNKLCIKCHRAKKSAGEKTGPVTCSSCHQK